MEFIFPVLYLLCLVDVKSKIFSFFLRAVKWTTSCRQTPRMEERINSQYTTASCFSATEMPSLHVGL